jgi:hypothetical protein
MTLKFKRNKKLIFTTIAVLSFLVIVLGNQPIIAYITY